MKTKALKALSLLLTFVLLFSVMSVCVSGSEQNEKRTYKNVILFIGDGMGINSIRAAKKTLGIEEQTLNMEKFPVRAWSKTRSLTDKVTDSAAGGTALATGVRTYNGSIAHFLLDPLGIICHPLNLTDVAIQEGKSTGVITTDKTDGATPASFSAHAIERGMSADISKDQLSSEIDLIWGAASSEVTQSACEKKGFTYVTTAAAMNELEPGSRSFGQFSFDDFSHVTVNETTPSIEQMTEKAIELLSADEDGFFLMVEGAQIDKKSHSNLMKEMAAQLYEFDKAIGTAMSFAEQDGDTLIVITADHETGGITLDERTGGYYYTTGSHSGVNVPVFVSAEDAGFKNGVALKNMQVSRNICAVLDTDGRGVLGEVKLPIFELFKTLSF